MNSIPENHVLEPLDTISEKHQNPFRSKLENRTRLLLCVAAYFLVRTVTGIADINLSPPMMSDTGVVTLIGNIIEFVALLIIGKYIYKNIYGAIVFSGLIVLSETLAAALTDMITKPFFIFTPFSPEATKLTSWVSMILSLVFAFAVILLFTYSEKKDDPDPDAENRFPKNPALFLILTTFLCDLLLSIPSALPMGFLIGASSFDSDMTLATNFTNNVMPIILSAVSVFSTLLYYLIIKKKYRLSKRAFCLIAIISFAGGIAALTNNLFNTGVNVLVSSLGFDELITKLILSNSTAIISLIVLIATIAVLSPKLEPEIRKMK